MKAVMFKTTIASQEISQLKCVCIQVENQTKNQKYYPPPANWSKNVDINTLELLNRKNCYNDVILDKCKKIQDNL